MTSRGPDALLVGRVRGALAEHEAVALGILFGSRARGDERPDSDLDLAVLAHGVDLPGLAARLSAGLGLELHVVELDGLGVPMLEQILEDGIIVREGRPGAAALWRSRALAQLETDRPWYARMRDSWLERVATRGL